MLRSLASALGKTSITGYFFRRGRPERIADRTSPDAGDHARKWKLFTILILATITLELTLRLGFGFCDAVLLRSDPTYEYIAVASQDRQRFGNHIQYNSHSMRSSEVDSTALRILGFGDSVINGGTPTDQSELATSMLSEELSQQLGHPVQFLNISAGSWGPDNAAAYLQEHGDFGASAIVLVVSSHDARDNMDFNPIVGVDRNFPDKQYKLALWELLDRYVRPRILKGEGAASLGINKDGKFFNVGFSAILHHATEHDLPFTMVLHPEQRELKAGSYDADGQQIIAFAMEHGVHLVESIHAMQAADYRDNIHLNAQGQRRLADLLLKDMRNHPEAYGLPKAP